MQLYPFILQTVTGLSGSEARRYSPPANVWTVSAMIMVDKCKEARRGRYYLFDKKAEVHNLTREPKPQYVVIIYELKVIRSLTYELSYIRAHKDTSAGGAAASPCVLLKKSRHHVSRQPTHIPQRAPNKSSPTLHTLHPSAIHPCKNSRRTSSARSSATTIAAVCSGVARAVSVVSRGRTSAGW